MGKLEIIFMIILFGCFFLLGYLSYNMINGNTDAPHDWITKKDIQVFPDKVIINIANVTLTSYRNTGSMRPALDWQNNGLKINVKNESDIHLGDIVTYDDGDDLIVHRVIKIGTDDKGIYYILKGDNNPISDGKIRFSQIRGVLIGMIY